MQLTIVIDMNNAAFHQEDGQIEPVEVRRILSKAAQSIVANGGHGLGNLRDLNGNTVGSWVVADDA